MLLKTNSFVFIFKCEIEIIATTFNQHGNISVIGVIVFLQGGNHLTEYFINEFTAEPVLSQKSWLFSSLVPWHLATTSPPRSPHHCVWMSPKVSSHSSSIVLRLHLLLPFSIIKHTLFIDFEFFSHVRHAWISISCTGFICTNTVCESLVFIHASLSFGKQIAGNVMHIPPAAKPWQHTTIPQLFASYSALTSLCFGKHLVT